MDFWHWGGFFKSVKGHVIKWWQQVILPVFHVNNNGNQNVPNDQTAVVGICREENVNIQSETQPVYRGTDDEDEAGRDMDTGSTDTESAVGNNNDAEDILKQWEREKQVETEKKRKEIEEMRKKRQEQERIESIMNANKVDVNAFIAAGKASRENTPKNDDVKEQEDMRRAQEILDRLNRKAAEDEARKKAEIEAARKAAEEKFGID